jgi:hypothetical protein
MGILIVGMVIPPHGWTECPACKTKQYYVGDSTYPEDQVTIDHDKKEIRIG